MVPTMLFYLISFGHLSTLSVDLGNWLILFLIRRPPALPHRLQCSTIGRPGLNRRVRHGNGCCPRPHRRQIFWSSRNCTPSSTRFRFASSHWSQSQYTSLLPSIPLSKLPSMAAIKSVQFLVDNQTVKHIFQAPYFTLLERR